jgi:general secretion pathway protein D
VRSLKKYRSRTQESDGNTAKPADPAPSAPSGNNTNSNKPNDALSQQQQALRDIEDDSSNERETFGRENPSAPKVEKKEYVNLNFETAFGPEVVTSFDFPDADILEITKFMQKLTGINLILDKDVKGKVSITAPTPITVGDAWKAYLTALNMAGYALVKSGAFYKIINSRDLRYTPTKIYTGSYVPDTENFAMMKVVYS